jgi:Putative binding domain, N-terminal/Calx-beta domain
MKFANVYRVLSSSRFALRLALFSFLCLLVFALNSTRLQRASAAAPVAATQQKQQRAGGKKSGAANAKVSSRLSEKAAAKAASVKPREDVQPSAVCTQNTPINFGQVNGTLADTDCVDPIRQDSNVRRVDEYTFFGTAGQQVAISLTANFDTYLFLLRPDGTVLQENDDINPEGTGQPPDTNSRIPVGNGFIILPFSGTYSILASSFAPETRGNYTLTLTAGANCSLAPIAFGETKAGTLGTGDCTNSIDLDNTFVDLYTFNGTAGQQISVTMTSSSGNAIDPYLYLLLPNGELIAEDDNGGGGSVAHIPTVGDFARLPVSGTYTIVANTVATSQSGNYNLTLTQGPTCTSTPIALGGTANGALAPGDCRILEDGSFIDAYTFNGTAGQQIVLSLTSGNSGLVPVLFLLAPNGDTLAIERSPTGSDTARIPVGSGSFTLPTTGAYTVLANSFAAGQTGNYTFRLINPAGCTSTLTPTSRDVGGTGGQFTVAVATQGGCTLTAVSNNTDFITVNSSSIDSNGNGTVTYSVTANPTSSPRTGTITINGQTFTVNQAAACSYVLAPSVRPFRDAGGAGRFTVVTQSGCSWTAVSNAPWITVISGFGAGTGTGRARYTVAANTTNATRIGAVLVNGITHTVTQTSVGTTPSIQFSSLTYMVNEADASKAATITVTRTGDVNGAATVEYATVDNPEAVPCDPTVKKPDGTLFPQGTAYARCDYATTVDTLTFGIGETVKTFTIPLINDVHVEGNEIFRISLSNAQGATLGGQSSADVTIQFDDTAQPTGNPINQTPFFVRMQYLDFLSREPEPSEPWSAVLNNCPNRFNGAADFNNVSAGCDRIITSQSFFGSPEFRLKGLPVFLYYKASFGAANNPNYYPEYDQFAPDLRRVSGATAAEVFAKRLDFAEDFVARTAFVNAFADTVGNNAAFVDRLLANINVNLTVADPVSGETRNSLVNSLNAGTKSRADVLRIIVESTEAANVQFNQAFVAMQYFGYLRRTPDASGYQAWLNVLNNPAIDPRARPRLMIDGFMNSTEYRFRFGPNTTQP